MDFIKGTTFSKRIINQIFQTMPLQNDEVRKIQEEGIVTSVNEFLALLQQANKVYSDTFKIPETKQLVIAEEFPTDLVQNINNKDSIGSVIDEKTLKDLRIVTYTVDEKPGTVSSHKPGEVGIQSIKERLLDIRDDEEFTGFSIVRYGKDIEATISFKVWGISLFDIRERAKILREVMNNNTWFFKHKGLRDIIWLKSTESEVWDGRTLIKHKTEDYIIRFVEIKQIREKNIEQIAIQLGLSS